MNTKAAATNRAPNVVEGRGNAALLVQCSGHNRGERRRQETDTGHSVWGGGDHLAADRVKDGRRQVGLVGIEEQPQQCNGGGLLGPTLARPQPVKGCQ